MVSVIVVYLFRVISSRPFLSEQSENHAEIAGNQSIPTFSACVMLVSFSSWPLH